MSDWWAYLFILFHILLFIFLGRVHPQDLEKLFFDKFLRTWVGMIFIFACGIFIGGLMLCAWGWLIYKFCMFIFDTVSNWF